MTPDQWLKWSGIEAKPSKCKCIAIEASSGRAFDPGLHIRGKIHFIGRQPVWLLGGTIQVPNNPSLARDNISSKLEGRKQKLKLYRLGICPRLSWDLMISEFPYRGSKKNLDPFGTRYLKKWSGLARPADPAILLLPSENGGLNPQLPSTLYQKLQVGRASLLVASTNNVVGHAVRQHIEKEQQ